MAGEHQTDTEHETGHATVRTACCVICGQNDPDDTATLSDGTARRVHGRCLPATWRARLEIVPGVQGGVPCLPISRLPADQFGAYASEPDGGAWVLTEQGWPYLTQAHLAVCRWYVGAYRKRVLRRPRDIANA